MMMMMMNRLYAYALTFISYEYKLYENLGAAENSVDIFTKFKHGQKSK